VHNKAAENKVDELQRLRNNTVSGRPPAPLMWKNRYACNEVPQKKEYDYMEGLFPRINREPNDYNLSSLASTSSAAKSGKIYGDGFKSSGSSDMSSRDTDGGNSVSGNSSMLQANKSQFKRLPLVEDQNANLKGEHPRNGEELRSDTMDVVKEHEEHEIGFRDLRKCTHDRFMETNLKLKDPENPSLSVDSSTNRVNQIFDDVDVGECEIRWEELVIGERIGLGKAYGLLDAFVMFSNLGIIAIFFNHVCVYARMHICVCVCVCMHVSLCIYEYVLPIVKIMVNNWVSYHLFPLVEAFETIGNLLLIKVYCLWWV
jgi:hypothetical protein